MTALVGEQAGIEAPHSKGMKGTDNPARIL